MAATRVAHHYRSCRDEDCQRALCLAYRDGYEDGLDDGLAAAGRQG